VQGEFLEYPGYLIGFEVPLNNSNSATSGESGESLENSLKRNSILPELSTKVVCFIGVGSSGTDESISNREAKYEKPPIDQTPATPIEKVKRATKILKLQFFIVYPHSLFMGLLGVGSLRDEPIIFQKNFNSILFQKGSFMGRAIILL